MTAPVTIERTFVWTDIFGRQEAGFVDQHDGVYDAYYLLQLYHPNGDHDGVPRAVFCGDYTTEDGARQQVIYKWWAARGCPDPEEAT